MWKRLRFGRVRISRLIGVIALFSGAALLTHILSGVSLALSLSVATCVLAVSMVWLWRRASPVQRSLLLRLLRVGAVSGLLATLLYDGAKFVLSQLDPSPYNPFELIHKFGVLLLGAGAPDAVLNITGAAFHLLNGISFGIAYCFLFRRQGILPGIAWGLFLEMFQYTLYPGWLSIRFYSEFVQISALSHIVYGATLGTTCRYLLGVKGRWWGGVQHG